MLVYLFGIFGFCLLTTFLDWDIVKREEIMRASVIHCLTFGYVFHVRYSNE